MKKTIQLLTLLLITTLTVTVASAAEVGRVEVKVLESNGAKSSIAGAIAEITPKDNPNGKVYYSSNGAGKIEIPALQYGEYTMSVTFLGFDPANIEFKVESSTMTLPNISMTPTSIEMEIVVKEVKALRTSQHGDSVRYNAAAFKVAADADVEGLLQKMPGIEINDGVVKAQGETVKKIFVDSDEFFGDDVSMAIKSLPAEIVERIEVYDKLSDLAELTGIDDGNSVKAINIVTKKNMRQGVFGKVFAGGGYEPTPTDDLGTKGKYMGGGNVNLFNEKRRFSFIGMLNNINQQNFSFEDISSATKGGGDNDNFMVRPLPGVAKVSAFGVNYNESFGKEKQAKLQACYFYNNTKTENIQETIRWYEAPATDDVDSMYQRTYSNIDNYNSRIDAVLKWKIKKTQSLTLRSKISFQSGNPYNDIRTTLFDDNNWASYGGQKDDGSTSNEIKSNYFLNLGASYSAKIHDNGRSLFAGLYYDDYHSKSNVESSILASSTDPTGETDYNYQINPTNKYGYFGSFNLTEPLGNGFLLAVIYAYNHTVEASDKDIYSTDEFYLYGNTDIPETTNDASNAYIVHRVGPGLRYYKEKLSLVANFYYQNGYLTSESNTTNTSLNYSSFQPHSKTYEHFTYMFTGKIPFNSESMLKINLSSGTTVPPAWRFNNSTSNSNYVVLGNAELNPIYKNNFSINFNHSDTEKGRTFMANLSANGVNDYWATHTILSPNAFQVDGIWFTDADQFTTYVNLDNNWNFNTNFTYGLPMDFIKCNFNISLGVGYSIIPSIYGGEFLSDGTTIVNSTVTNTNRLNYRVGATLSSNISENIDFTFRWSGTYSDAANYDAANSVLQNRNTYLDHTASGNVKYIFGGGFTLTANATYKQYLGITNDFNDQYIFCSAYLGRKFLRDNRGELNIGINDIFNQNVAFSRSVSTNYTQNLTNSSIGRYVSFNFIYNIRHFGKMKRRGMKVYKMDELPEDLNTL